MLQLGLRPLQVHLHLLLLGSQLLLLSKLLLQLLLLLLQQDLLLLLLLTVALWLLVRLLQLSSWGKVASLRRLRSLLSRTELSLQLLHSLRKDGEVLFLQASREPEPCTS